MDKKEGIGSYFHFESPEKFQALQIPFDLDYKLFYTGRHALLHILNEITSSREISNIWFPNYYCQHTLGWIKKSYPNINLYEINPFDFSNDNIDVLGFTTNKDVVLINNYWGLSTMFIEEKTNFPIIIEDHSHGWLSDACLNSKADYCFVSLRKSLPIPLGGMCWKPNTKGLEIKIEFKNNNEYYQIWDTMLKAMELKSEYIYGNNTISPSNYLSLFYKTEECLNNNFEFSKVKNKHRNYINSFLHFNTRQAKEKHLSFLYKKITDNKYFKIIKRESFTAFGLHLLFKNETHFNDLKSYLVSNCIYPSSLWPDNHIEYEWRYFLNIHIDFRYNLQDLEYIVMTINNWLKEH